MIFYVTEYVTGFRKYIKQVLTVSREGTQHQAQQTIDFWPADINNKHMNTKNASLSAPHFSSSRKMSITLGGWETAVSTALSKMTQAVAK